MPKVSVYLSDELYAAARERGLSVSSLAQDAIARELDRRRTEDWAARVRARPPRCRDDVDTASLIDAVRRDFDE